MSRDAKLEELRADLESDGEAFFKSGFWNNIADLSLTIITVLASLVAAGLAVAEPNSFPRWLIPTLAAIPAAAATIQKVAGVRERSNWYFMYAAQVRSLATRLKYASSPNVEEMANERARIEIKMEEEWTKIGSSAVSSRGHRPTV
jgi:hypothetical protein